MPDPINLRHARKAKARVDKEKHAAENRARFGRPKAERDAEAQRDMLLRRLLDGHAIDSTLPPQPAPSSAAGSPQGSRRGPAKK